MSANKNSYEALLAQIRDNYLRELPEKFDAMEALVLQMMQSNDKHVFESLFRATHSMKGSAGTYGLDILTTICHNLEDCYYDYQHSQQADNSDAMQGWLAYIDLLRRAYTLLEEQFSDFNLIESELAKLRSLRKQFQFRGLIVAQSDLDIAVIEKTFADLGVDFSLVHDGMEGLERLLNERFDLYVCSNQLPRLNGISIIAAVKQTPGLNRDAISLLISSASHSRHGRISDPDHLLHKDHQLLQNMEKLAGEIVATLRER